MLRRVVPVVSFSIQKVDDAGLEVRSRTLERIKKRPRRRLIDASDSSDDDSVPEKETYLHPTYKKSTSQDLGHLVPPPPPVRRLKQKITFDGRPFQAEDVLGLEKRKTLVETNFTAALKVFQESNLFGDSQRKKQKTFCLPFLRVGSGVGQFARRP